MARYGTWDATHEENAQLAGEIERLAKAHGLQVVHNVSSYSKFDGYHRYLVLTPGETAPSIRAKRCLFYTESRYSKYFVPSIVGEYNALVALRHDLWERTHASEHQ